MADSTLGAIRTKVRRLTRSPSTSQLTDAQIDEYVNTFFLYDFPEHLRLFSLRTTFTFYTEAFIDTYDSSNASDALFNFQNRFVTFHTPAFIAGFPALFSQSEAQFFGMYPKLQSILSIGTAGDGVTTAFAGTIQNAPFLRNNVVLSSVDANAITLVAKDVPLSVSTGSLVDPNTSIIIGLINYITGVFNVTFPSAPAAGAPIKSEVVPYKPSIPQSILFYDNKFTLRPVPDLAYMVTMEAYIRPTELLAAPTSPQIEQWWQYIAYGASKKIFEDRMDLDSVQLIMPEFKMQERMVLRTTIVQHTNERTATIYTNQLGLGSSWGWGSNNGGFQ